MAVAPSRGCLLSHVEQIVAALRMGKVLSRKNGSRGAFCATLAAILYQAEHE